MQGNILLVEDHRDLAMTVLQALEMDGYTVDYAADGALGLQLASTQVFDCLSWT